MLYAFNAENADEVRRRVRSGGRGLCRFACSPVGLVSATSNEEGASCDHVTASRGAYRWFGCLELAHEVHPLFRRGLPSACLYRP